MAPDHRRLKRLLAQRMASTVERAVESGGAVEQEELDSLARLSRLIEISSSSAPGVPRRFWIPAALLAATLVVISLMLFARVDETEVELDIGTSEINFSLPSQQVLFENVELASLGVSGLDRIQLPEPLDRAFPSESLGSENGAIRLELASDATRTGAISIAALVPSGDSEVWLRRTDLARQYRLSINNPRLRMQVDVVGPVRISLAGMASQTIDLAAPRAIELDLGSGIADVDLQFLDPAAPSLTPQIPIRNLAFFRVDEFADGDVSIVRHLSTILSGTLYLESLNGAARPLRAGEALRFVASEGEIRTTKLEADGLKVNFHGRVRGMQVGSEDSPRSLMPTWLEWLQARHGLTLLWGTTVYVFGLLLGVARSLKVAV